MGARQEVRTLISQGDLRHAAEKLSNILRREPELHRESILLSGRLAELRKRERRGVLSTNEASARRNEISMAILDILDEASERIGNEASESQPLVVEKEYLRSKRANPVFGNYDPSKCKPPSIFLSYVKEDEPRAKAVFEGLRQAGFCPWMDSKNLRAGQDWDRILRLQVSESDYFVVLQSKNLKSRDFSYVHKEVDLALDKQRRAATGVTYLIPVLLDKDAGLNRLKHLQSMPMQSDRDLQNLVDVILQDFGHRRQRSQKKGD